MIVSWHIWICRNNIIFQGKQLVWTQIIPKICKSYLEIPEETQVTRTRHITLEVIDRGKPWAYFDGAAQDQGCGSGIILHISESHYCHISLGLGNGTNNFAELMTLRHMLHFATSKNYRQLHIFGDSKMVINWFNCTTTCHAYSLRTILDDVLFLKSQFDLVSCTHVYRERNAAADRLSKETTNHPRGEWLIKEHIPA